MRDLGIIAGMGPFASTSFIRRILEMTPAPKEWDHIRMLVDYNVRIPSRTRALLYGEASPKAGMVETINGLAKAGESVVAVPCNSAHFWYDEVCAEIEVPWLNLIEITSRAVLRKKATSALVLGAYVTVQKRLYDRYLANTMYLNQTEQDRLLALIERLKLDHDKWKLLQVFEELVQPYRENADVIILACTEPSMMFENGQTQWNSFAIIDSTHEYAKACVEFCKGIRL